MPTFLRLQDVVASETRFVNRISDLQPEEGEQIRLHINEAIRAHQKDHFWFNQQLWERATEADKEFYALPADYVAGLTVSITDYPRSKLISKANDTIEGWVPAAENTRPQYYALFANQYRLYPIPDAVYQLRLWGIRSFDDLIGDTDENPWTNEAFELIREAAKERVFYSLLHDVEKAGIAGQAAATRRAGLIRETILRQPRQEIEPFL